MDAPPGSAHVAAGPVNPPTPQGSGVWVGRGEGGSKQEGSGRQIGAGGGGRVGSMGPPYVQLGAQSAAARALGGAWGSFGAQPGAAGDSYLRSIDSWGSSGVTLEASWGPLGDNFHGLSPFGGQFSWIVAVKMGCVARF